MSERGVEDIERPVGLGWKFPDAVALGRWINPLLWGLGAVVLSGHLMARDPSAPAVTAPAPLSIAQPGSAPMLAPLAPGNTAVVRHSGVAQDESTRCR